jgi:hypothetical protein
LGAPMLDRVLEYGLQYAIYSLEIGLFLLLLLRGQWKRLLIVSVYLISLLVVDALLRPYFLYRYGLRSGPYAYCYWLTDVVLALEAFGLLCIFFRRACTEKMWHVLRLLLALVFVLVAAISSLSISHNYSHQDFQHVFIFEFEQNLFFTCVVLNTLLYIMLQQIGSTDDQLGLLVCGMGIQFAGPTAGLALLHLTAGGQAAYLLLHHIAPLCTLGMLLIWIYAVRRFPTSQEATYRTSRNRRGVPALAGASLRAD